MVDLLIAPRCMQHSAVVTVAPGGLVAVDVPGLLWLMNSPKRDTFTIDEDGWT